MPGDESSIAIIPEPFRKDLDLPVLISANMAHRLARDIPPTFAPPMRLVASVGLERMLMAIRVVAQVIGVSGVIESAKPELRGLAKQRAFRRPNDLSGYESTFRATGTHFEGIVIF